MYKRQEVRHQFELMDYPTPIAHILDKVGFKIYKENLSANISGVIGVSDSLIEARGCKRIMLINAYENRGHQRFTMAHELGHYIFDYDGKSDFADEYSLDKERLTSETEIRVNRFACLLYTSFKSSCIKKDSCQYVVKAKIYPAACQSLNHIRLHRI